MARISLPDVPVTRQLSRNTCVPCCLDMLLEIVRPGRSSTNIENLIVRPLGMHTSDAMAFIFANFEEFGLEFVRGELSEALADGCPFIAIMGSVHAILVQEVETIDGVLSAVVRDPMVGAYIEDLNIIDAYLVRDKEVLGHPVIWCRHIGKSMP